MQTGDARGRRGDLFLGFYFILGSCILKIPGEQFLVCKCGKTTIFREFYVKNTFLVILRSKLSQHFAKSEASYIYQLEFLEKLNEVALTL